MLERPFLPSFLEWNARVILIAIVSIAPWLLGGVPSSVQRTLIFGVLLAYAVWGIAAICRIAVTWGSPLLRRSTETRLPVSVLLLSLLTLVGMAQLLLPARQFPISAEWVQILAESDADETDLLAAENWTLSAAMTRFELARLVAICAAAFLATQLFVTSGQIRLLFAVIAVNGAALAIFGIGQLLTWNGMLLGTIPLRYGGVPFATFVNRNNAAGFLNLCLAAGIGGLLLAGQNRFSSGGRQRVLMLSVLCVFITGGVVATASRGGIASTAIALVAVSPILLKRFGKSAMIGGAAGLAGVMLLGSWLHFGELATTRLQTLRQLSTAMDSRLQHWSDTLVACFDRPLLGSGWGTYRYANLPYQNHHSGVWFWNADNQHLEVAVEGGAVAYLLCLAILVSFAVSAIRLIRSERGDDGTALGACGIFVLTALGLQSVTDFGISLLSLALLASVLLGCISGVAVRQSRAVGRDLSELIHSPTKQFLRFGVTVYTVILLSGLCWAGREVSLQQPGLTFCEQLPVHLNAPDLIPPAQLDQWIAEGERLSDQVPDNAVLQLAIARLQIYRAQHSLMSEIGADDSSTRARAAAWEQVQLENLFDPVRLNLTPEWPELLKRNSVAHGSLQEATLRLQKSWTLCPRIPGVQVRLAQLHHFINPALRTPGQLLLGEAILSAGDADKLLSLGRLSIREHHDELAIQCWRRAIDIAPETISAAVASARIGLEDAEICRRLLTTPEQLIAFSELTHDVAARAALAAQLKEMQQSEGGEVATGRRAWISSHIALLAGNEDEAIRELRNAIEQEPFQVPWRLQLAELLIAQGQLATAREHLAFASRLAPSNAEIKKRLTELIKRELESSSTSDSTPTGLQVDIGNIPCQWSDFGPMSSSLMAKLLDARKDGASFERIMKWAC